MQRPPIEQYRSLLERGRADQIDADDIEWLCDYIDYLYGYILKHPDSSKEGQLND